MKNEFRALRSLIRWPLYLLLTLPLFAQQQPPGFIQGVVSDTFSDTPLAKVTVELRNPGEPTAISSTITDTDGRFYLSTVRPGSYKLVAMRSGYANSEFGQRQPGGPSQSVIIAPAQRTADLRITMTRAGAISGHVLENGAPVGIADVAAVKVTFIEDQPSFSLVLAAKTNDLGEYHIFWLPPGKYLVMAIIWDTASSIPIYTTPEGSNENTFITTRRSLRSVFNRANGSGAAENEAHVPFFYPNSTDSQSATVVEIRPGDELRNMDIQASALGTRHVKGTVTGAIPPPNPNLIRLGLPTGPSVRLIPIQSIFGTNDAQSPFVNAEANGSFEFKSVISGRYMLIATAGAVTGSMPVEVRDRDIDGMSVALIPGMSVSGQAIMDGPATQSPIPLPAGLRITLRPDPLIPGTPTYTGVVAANGSFVVPSLPPNPNIAAAAAPPTGMYRVLVTPLLTAPTSPDATLQILPPALQKLYVKSIRAGEIDVLKDGLRIDHAIEDLKIVIGSNPASLEGHVLSYQLQPLASAVVALVPDDSLRYRINHKWISSDASGGFQFQNIPPGDYLLFAWASIEKGGWQDAGVLRDYEAQGKPIHVDEGGKLSVDISAIPARN